jgi:hypothetical protein
VPSRLVNALFVRPTRIFVFFALVYVVAILREWVFLETWGARSLRHLVDASVIPFGVQANLRFFVAIVFTGEALVDVGASFYGGLVMEARWTLRCVVSFAFERSNRVNTSFRPGANYIKLAFINVWGKFRFIGIKIFLMRLPSQTFVV